MSLFKYVVILGRQPELGLVELESLFGERAVRPYGRQAALVNRSVEVSRLGGVLKVGRVLYEGPVVELGRLPEEVMLDLPMRNAGKVPFALSTYGFGPMKHRQAMAMGLELKKRLRGRGSVRLVAPTEGSAVTAAQLKHNQVLERGFELLVVRSNGGMVVALTESVQDIDWYSRRDYDRPARSARVGMLPPKLAQVLVNSTQAPVVVDPFCGTGVVLQEALLLGREAVGSDVAPEMVEATKTNLEWLGGVSPTPLSRWQVTESDARVVKLPKGSAVVSEGYLGPNLSQAPSTGFLREIKAELQDLYRAVLKNFASGLAAGGEVSICVPAWRAGKHWDYLDLVDELADLGYTLKGFKHVRTPLLYARDDQVVGRQLLLLRKK